MHPGIYAPAAFFAHSSYALHTHAILQRRAEGGSSEEDQYVIRRASRRILLPTGHAALWHNQTDPS